LKLNNDSHTVGFLRPGGSTQSTDLKREYAW
jgi:hypothetical protein